MAAGKNTTLWSRLVRRFRRPFLKPKDKARIAALIAKLEARTTGEIHVHVAAHPGEGDILEIARRKFFALGLDKTRQRNGVLILVSHLDHRFAIWGDEGIHAKAGQALWERAKKALRENFHGRYYADGLEECVNEVGRELIAHFPKNGPDTDTNELTDEVSES